MAKEFIDASVWIASMRTELLKQNARNCGISEDRIDSFVDDWIAFMQKVAELQNEITSLSEKYGVNLKEFGKYIFAASPEEGGG